MKQVQIILVSFSQKVLTEFVSFHGNKIRDMHIIKLFLGTVSLSRTARDQVGQGRKVLISGTNRCEKNEKREVCDDVWLHVNSVTGNTTDATAR